MGLLLLAAFIGVPLIEIALFIEVGGAIGLWPTLAIVVLTAIAGSSLLRIQGTATLARARAQIDRNVLPAKELFDGLCLLFAGALLLTPGFFTDVVGLALFVPPLRDTLRGFVARYIETHGETRVFVDGEEVDPRDPRRRRHRGGDGVIDADFREVDEDGGTGKDAPSEDDGDDPRRIEPGARRR